MYAKVRIRGIYGTALTRLLADAGCAIVDPSPEVQGRLDLKVATGNPEVVIHDRDDRQGVRVRGETEGVCHLLRLLQARLLDVAMMSLKPVEEKEGWVEARVEFPGVAKETLDRVRSTAVPTMARHHRLQIVWPRGVAEVERELSSHPEEKERLETEAFSRAVLLPLSQAESVQFEHVRISGKTRRPRKGSLLRCGDQTIVMKRALSGKRYDGLDLPIEDGDYAVTEIQEGAWWVKHAYYSGDGVLKGEHWNVNTPVEIYPRGARYVDLAVDVIRRAGESPCLVDKADLEDLTRKGLISSALEQRAMDVAEGLLRRLSS